MVTPAGLAPNYNYTIDAPENWIVIDTVLNWLRVRFIKHPPYLTDDKPMVNVIVVLMDTDDIDLFTQRNIDYLSENTEGAELQERGKFNASKIEARWFTYRRAQNGIERDMINYIIPLKGFAYMITCGTNKGAMIKYRSVFDKIAKSFKG